DRHHRRVEAAGGNPDQAAEQELELPEALRLACGDQAKPEQQAAAEHHDAGAEAVGQRAPEECGNSHEQEIKCRRRGDAGARPAHRFRDRREEDRERQHGAEADAGHQRAGADDDPAVVEGRGLAHAFPCRLWSYVCEIDGRLFGTGRQGDVCHAGRANPKQRAPGIEYIVAPSAATARIDRRVQVKTYQLYINGQYVDPANGEWFDSVDPYRGEAWAKIPRGSRADADKAVEAANEAMWRGPWSKMTASARGKAMRKLGDLVAANAERLAEIEVRDNGKLMAEMLGQVRYHPEWWWYFGGMADKLEGGLVPID